MAGLAGSRLVTETGPGRVGKTRLAVEVATRLAGAYPDDAWLVDVAGVHDADELAAAVAAGLSLGEQGGRPSPDTLAAALRERRLLLDLDNCEHVLHACAALVERLHRGAGAVAHAQGSRGHRHGAALPR